MNTKQLIAAVAVFAAAGSAFADANGTSTNYTNVPAAKSRVEVAELKQAQGQAPTPKADSSSFVAKSGRTREEVRAEALEYAKARKPNHDYDFGG